VIDANLGLTLGASTLLVPTVGLLLECLSAPAQDALANSQGCSASDSAYSAPSYHPTRVVLMPAHNEAFGIRATLDSLLPQLSPGDRLVVIADNCTDETAEIARAQGATVIERQDNERRGKGYALDFGLKYLADSSEGAPEAVVMVDADCWVQPGTIDRLVRVAISTQRPTQAIYLLDTPLHPSPKDRVSAFAFKVKNLVRPLGLWRLGQPCLLTGTGMAFPWVSLQAVDLASGNLVEDMKLGLDLAIAGYPPILCPDTLVLGQLPQSASTAITQRTRWEHGHMKTLLDYGPKLVWASINQGQFGLAALAVDLCVPPLSLLVTLWLGMTALLAASVLLGISLWPLVIAMVAGVAMAVAITTAWLRFAQADLPLAQLLSVPLYILWKIPMYFQFLVKPQNQWVRTNRDG
jgi:cellulose synthase/poly-beta-1,6-N-acetylglucosamine synthase-like glycosyltransferase